MLYIKSFRSKIVQGIPIWKPFVKILCLTCQKKSKTEKKSPFIPDTVSVFLLKTSKIRWYRAARHTAKKRCKMSFFMVKFDTGLCLTQEFIAYGVHAIYQGTFGRFEVKFPFFAVLELLNPNRIHYFNVK